MSEISHYQHLVNLLQKEREEDLALYLRDVRQRPLSERVEQGYTWYPLQVVQTGFALGEKAWLIVERTSRLNEPHQFKSGQSVNLFTQAPHVKTPEKQGVIHFVDRNRMKIILNARDVPDWIAFGQLGVDQLFDDRSYQEMDRALQKVIAAKGDRVAELRQLFDPSVPKQKWKLQNTTGDDSYSPLAGLNDSQNEAIQHIISAPLVTIVHGPPGTGKTTTLVAAIAQLVQQESTVLVTAPSNTAADLLTERLAQASLNVVRIGNISRVDDSVMMHTLDAILSRHPESKNIRKVKLQAAEYRRQAKKHKRSFNAEDRREREHLKHQARELESWAYDLEQRLVDQVLSGAQAIICTLVGAAHPVLEKYRFRTCVIDEAAQALEPACWIPILKCSRVVLAGDPFQLPPTVKSLEAARNGLSRTLIERCLDLLPDQVHLLTVQYRMHRAIMDFSNQYFYKGALSAHESVGERRLLVLEIDGETLTVFEPVVFIDTAGTGFEEKVNKSQGKNSHRFLSKYNPDEAVLLREHLIQLLPYFTDAALMPSIGILSPYREQVNYLEEILRPDFPDKSLSINTIDGFQGQERDIVYISLVRSNDKNEIGFLSDYRRMNVAMTRARKLLVVIGDSATIGNNPFYAQFLEYCEKNGSYQSAWEYMR